MFSPLPVMLSFSSAHPAIANPQLAPENATRVQELIKADSAQSAAPHIKVCACFQGQSLRMRPYSPVALSLTGLVGVVAFYIAR